MRTALVRPCLPLPLVPVPHPPPTLLHSTLLYSTSLCYSSALPPQPGGTVRHQLVMTAASTYLELDVPKFGPTVPVLKQRFPCRLGI